MTQAELNREVAFATGESMSTVRNLGFVMLTPVPYERDRDPLVVDWDEVEMSRAVLHPV
ncbi:MAG: hypothetical protein ABI614_09830 [Planctomycetota bacterium]